MRGNGFEECESFVVAHMGKSILPPSPSGEKSAKLERVGKELFRVSNICGVLEGMLYGVKFRVVPVDAVL